MLPEPVARVVAVRGSHLWDWNREAELETSPSSAILVGAMLNLPELRFGEVLVPWILIVGVLDFLAAWLVVATMECTGLSRHVWHLPLFFAGPIILFSSLIGMVISP